MRRKLKTAEVPKGPNKRVDTPSFSPRTTRFFKDFSDGHSADLIPRGAEKSPSSHSSTKRNVGRLALKRSHTGNRRQYNTAGTS